MRGASHFLADHPLDLFQLLHEIHLGVQATGGVDDNDIKGVGGSIFDTVKNDRGRIDAGLPGHHLHPGPFSPDPELIDSRGPEGIAGHQQDRMTGTGKLGGNLADGRRLAHPVDADHQDDKGAGLRHIQLSCLVGFL
ncbi:hypothetical protein BMS3Abin13_01130 [bacterium BMS3Abin13]|nr:hypothetical protein BMS3Abin13_01130 [bacterium BMS3Abin13]